MLTDDEIMADVINFDLDEINEDEEMVLPHRTSLNRNKEKHTESTSV